MAPQEEGTEVKNVELGSAMQRAISECIRCGGFMVPTRYMDLLDGQLEFVAERCVQCGDVVDPVIRRNRSKQLYGCAHEKKVQGQPTEFVRWATNTYFGEYSE
jgi:hypothetical protein